MTRAVIRSDWVGRIIDGRFTLLEWLGGSERSGVYLTKPQGPRSQKAAIKLIPADAGDAEAYIAGWAVTTTLSHPHLMRLFHTGRGQIDATGLLYTVTEYAEEVLSEIIPERPLTPGEANDMLVPVLDPLFYLHGQGFVHGHLNPSKILVVDNQVKLSRDRLEITGELGKHYPTLRICDAPEVATEMISPAADVWSLGITLIEALTQHPPVWDRSNDREPDVPESIPQPFADIARECLRFDPARRCTISDIKARLEPVPISPKPGQQNRENSTCQTRRDGTHRHSALAARGNRISATAIAPESAIAANRKTTTFTHDCRAPTSISSSGRSNIQRRNCEGRSRGTSSAQRTPKCE